MKQIKRIWPRIRPDWLGELVFPIWLMWETVKNQKSRRDVLARGSEKQK